MPATVFEKPTGRGFTTSITEGPIERSLTFNISDAADSDDAEAAFLAAVGGVVPATDGGLPLERYEFGEDDRDGLFLGRAFYSNPTGGGGAIGETRLAFLTSGGTQHLTTSRNLETVYGAAAADVGYTLGVGQPIGATTDGVAGVTVPVSTFEWELEHTFEAGDVDDAYVAVIEELTGKVNNAVFKGRASGEVLFLGASGSQVNDGPWQIAFRFATSKNKTGIQVGSITGIVKNGWEHLDVHYTRGSIGANGFEAVVMIPKFVLVHTIYEDGDLNDLGI